MTHSVSFFECELGPNEWRIVLLFRNLWPQHVEFLQMNPIIIDPESKCKLKSKTKKKKKKGTKNKKKRMYQKKNMDIEEQKITEWNYDVEDTSSDDDIDISV